MGYRCLKKVILKVKVNCKLHVGQSKGTIYLKHNGVFHQIFRKHEKSENMTCSGSK